MAYENKSGLNVYNQYGPRDTGGTVGVETTENSISLYSFTLTGDSLNTAFFPKVVLPKGAQVKRAILRVDEAFTLGGTSPVLNIGQAGTEATNGITITQAELQAVGTKVPASTGNGTWAASSATTVASAIGKALGGTSPTVTAGVGKATLVLEVFNKTKV